MWLVWLLVGIVIGFPIGGFVALVLVAWNEAKLNKEAIANGVIKLNRKLFVLKEIDPRTF